MFSLELPHRGSSNEYTQYTIFNVKNHPRLSKICSYGFFSKKLKNAFKTAMINEPSVLEPLKVYCIRAHVKFCFKIIVRKAILLFPSLHDQILKKRVLQ